MNQQVIEEQLIRIISQTQNILQKFNKNKMNSIQIILLVGMTGAGKSTLFNFLAGAKFIYVENDEDGDELQVIQVNNQYSEMNDGMKSITREPKYYFSEEYCHLLIDFPGFSDTNGKIDQLLIQMIFQKITSQTPIKLVYVIRHPENTLLDRGIDLQEFIHQTIKQQDLDFTQFTIILNSYAEDLEDNILITKFQNDQIEIQGVANKNIQVVRKIKNTQTLNQYFSTERRQLLWQSLIESNTIQLTHNKLPNHYFINRYVLENSQKILQFYENLKVFFEQNIQCINNDSIPVLIRLIQELKFSLEQKLSYGYINEYLNITKVLITKLQNDFQSHSKIILDDKYKSWLNEKCFPIVNFFVQTFQCQSEIQFASEQPKNICLYLIQILQIKQKNFFLCAEKNARIQQEIIKTEEEHQKIMLFFSGSTQFLQNNQDFNNQIQQYQSKLQTLQGLRAQAELQFQQKVELLQKQFQQRYFSQKAEQEKKIQSLLSQWK